ncbi:BTAD domain-containing putative transcriptional regulator [Lentzea sp. NPDC060358]|uniref:AfsR/SARP family transcriptional regulator n=1 Tax=Lentzea sp. NPDC060358 TaxID=3347103 RepID=UPI00365818B2
MSAEYRVLGPLEVLLDGRPVPVPAGRGRVLLAVLLLRANEIVPVSDLVDRVWDGAPPAADRAHKTLQTVVLRLRQALGAANCVRTSSRGYSAVVEPGQLDLTRFRALTAQGDHHAALELWRGPALGNVTSESLHREDVPRLAGERLAALEERIDADLSRSTDVLVPELRSLVATHPLHETFWAQLMLALHGSGQRAEALSVYQDVRRHLRNQLGSAPGRRLRDAHEQVLRGGEPPVTRVVPRQLPPAHPHFVGREEELGRIGETLRTRPGAPVLISAINGIGGVGKTVLALQWAHQEAARFPDGQLYVDLRGFDRRAEPLDPFVAAREFLLALGVPATGVPRSDDEVVAAYRLELARRRVLLVLDNARDADQVRPLLPDGAGNQVLVTSRHRLDGLVREGARPLALDVLDDEAAVVLLTERIGRARMDAEPDAVSRLVERCAGLPLALGIVAARAACGDSLGTLADELGRERLDALDIDDPMTGIRGVFSWSLRSVSETAVRVLVLLGLHPGPDFSVAAAASLAGLPADEVALVLDELVGCSLVGAAATGRFVLHDLLRDYLRECVAELPEQQRSAARKRMLDHYVHTTWAACVHQEGGVRWPDLPPPATSAVVQAIADIEASHGWYEPEHRVLLAVLTELEDAGADDVLWTFSYSLHHYLVRSAQLAEDERVQLRGLAAARRQGSVFGQSRLNRTLAGVYIGKQDFVKAKFHLGEGLRCDEELGDENGVSNVSRGLAYLYELQGKYEDGLAVLHRIHPTAVNLETKSEKAYYLAAYGRAHHLVGENDRALELCLEARSRFVELNRPAGDANTCMNHETLADIYTALGRYDEAVESYQASVSVLRVLRDVPTLADILVQLSKAQLAAGDRASAREALDEALALYEHLDAGGSKSEQVRELLASTG